MPKARNADPEPGFDIGDHAEGRFDLWCRDVGIMATPPRKDREGWDYYLVLPGQPTQNLLDSPPKLNCSVQIKGQWKHTKKPPTIKLSNFERMISEPVPWFVCIVIYSAPSVPERCVIIHIDQKWVDRIAKLIWANDAKKNRRPLNKVDVRLRWDASQLLPALSGQAILECIRSHIGTSEHYVTNKIRWRQEAGVGDGRYALHFTMKGPNRNDYYKELAALAVGDIDKIIVSELETEEVRFGIGHTREKEQDASVSLIPPFSPIKVFFASTPVEETFEAEFEMCSAADVFPFLPKEFRRIRLKTAHLHLDMIPTETNDVIYRWHMNIPKESVKLSDLFQAARIMSSLLDAQSPLPEIQMPDGIRIKLPRVPYSAALSDDVIALLEAVKNAGVIADAFDLSPAEIQTTTGQLLRARRTLSQFAGLCVGTTRDIAVSIPATAALLDKKKAAYVFVPYVQIGDRCLFMLIAVKGIAQWHADNGGELRLQEPSAQVLERLIVSVDETKRKSFVKRVVAPMKERGHQIVTSDGFVTLQE